LSLALSDWTQIVKKPTKPNILRRLYAAVFAAAVTSTPVAAHAMGDEEFVGPFASWANVKTSYGAAGDGVGDDTTALQNALNALGPHNPTLYLPAGTYRITQTLALAGQQNVNVIGQDPAVTTILWGGASGGTMLYLNGVAYSRFDRLTFNGQGNAAVAVDQSKADGTSPYADTANEYADDVFENAGIGFRCGNLGFQCSETSMLRDQFINNTVAGVAMKNFNALDMFIWYSLFQNNAVGVTNSPGAGNFHVYNSIFQGSTVADISYANTGLFNFRNNFSIESKRFVSSGGTCAPDIVTIQGNTILDTTDPKSIFQADPGPMIFLDNIVRSAAANTTGPVVAIGNCTADLFSMGNTFTVSPPISAGARNHSIQDQVVPRSTVNPSPPILPGTPPNNNRRIFEVTPGSTAAQIQQLINQAAASGTTRPVVHIQPGSYSINTTLVVPANSDMQIIGDGGYSQLNWSPGSTAGPVIRLQGPSKAILRDFAVNGGANTADGIEIDNADQPGSRVFMEQSNLGASHTNLFVDGLDYTNVELHDFYHAYDSTTGMTSAVVTGGPSAAQGLWQGGATNILAGASAGNYLGYAVSNGAHVGVRDTFNDSGAGGNLVANATGTSAFTYAGSALYLPGSNPTVISLNNFQGTAALLNLNTNGDINITGASGTNAKVLGLGLVGPSSVVVSDTSSPRATTGFTNGQTTVNPPPGVGSSQLPEVGCCDTTFLTTTFNQLRTEQPTLLAPLPSGVTDARFYRVFVDYAVTGIHLEAASVAPPPPPPTTSLSANPTSINAGQSSTLSWSSTNATSCTGGNFVVTGMSGSAAVIPSTTTSYSISCSGSGGSATATATVTVAAPPPPAPTASLSASPTSITTGQSSTLSWSSTNATSCTGGGFTASGPSGSGVVTPSSPTTYSITCSGNGGSAAASATVTVATPPPAPTASLLAKPTSIKARQSSTLSWSSTNATSCTGAGFTASKISGSAIVKPNMTTTYSITCSGSGGSVTARATVIVAAQKPPAPTASVSANPSSINAGQSSTLSWRSTNATLCTGGNFTAT
jgi:hypothetical protein